MAILNIVKLGDEVLRKKSRKVDEITPRIITLLDDMKETLIASGGVGLAAPQVGVLKRIVLVDVGDGNIIELINPEIKETSGEQEGLEGCLSIPEQYGIVSRPMNVTVTATDRNGKKFSYSGSELTARCFCHEIDHLDGKLYIDVAKHILTPEEMKELKDDSE